MLFQDGNEQFSQYFEAREAGEQTGSAEIEVVSAEPVKPSANYD